MPIMAPDAPQFVTDHMPEGSGRGADRSPSSRKSCQNVGVSLRVSKLAVGEDRIAKLVGDKIETEQFVLSIHNWSDVVAGSVSAILVPREAKTP